ncbi:hypothetical protein [Crocinitomix catalasitica]|uniref:hypothetical protein n=1 Tax=Crocinitomix catalasitica TaxID=184607 RepID=UPI0004891E8C|nr:hypothetical protein [Crocinitomix catalasitica]
MQTFKWFKLMSKPVGLCFLFVLVIVSCTRNKSIEIDVDGIKSYVADITSPDREFAVGQSMKFSKENRSYRAIEYLLEDSIVLHYEELENGDDITRRSVYYKSGVPVFIDENIVSNVLEFGFVSRQIYTNGHDILSATERAAVNEMDLEFAPIKEANVNINDYDFDRAHRAVSQTGEFEMKFGEFLIIEPDNYLILENDKSNYNVALFFQEGDILIDSLQSNPDLYQGETIFVYHSFVMVSSIERMLYKGGFIVEDN